MGKDERKNTNKIIIMPEAEDPNAESKVKIEQLKTHAHKSEISRPKSKPKLQNKAGHQVSAVKEVGTQNLLPETKMEVHHHPQLEHNPKPWKEYLLEGFMIFIAVMMGFIAENIRDEINNSEHARQLTSQLVQDLKADTTNLIEIYRAETQIIKNNDTLFNLLQQPLAKADFKRSSDLLPVHIVYGCFIHRWEPLLPLKMNSI
jgi:hypothetical protein